MNWQDPHWTEVSASLRNGLLYVKLPREKAIFLVQTLIRENQDLIRKQILESDKTFVFYGSTDDWNRDLLTLKALEPSRVITEFILAVEAGLRNEAQVDWISRVGGPPRGEFDALDSLFSFDL